MFRRLLLVVIFVSCGFAAGLVLTGRMRSAEEARADAGTAAPQQAPVVAPPAFAGLPDLSGVASRAIPSVMNITSLNVVRQPNSPMMTDPLFRYFFGDREEMYGGRNRVAQSLGSGVIVSNDGYIMTNNHVVGSVNAQVSVVMPDRRELKAKIIGVDEWTDIALLKIDARGLPVLSWGDSSKLKVAEWVLAVGNPFQLSQTVTLGIVSALGRANIGAAAYEDFIQTDAAINPGNSGGALINGRGELIGINTAIYSQTGGYQGVGFAVPSNLARRVMDDLIKYGEVRRGSIGPLETVPLTTQLAEELGVSTDRGAVVARMARSGSAYQAGMRPGDVIVSFNGKPIEDPGQFLRMLSDSPIGSTVTIGVLRGGGREDLKVRVTQPQPRRR